MAASSSLLAQTAPVDEVVVTASRLETPLRRITYAADVIDKDAIQQGRPLLGLDEALQGVPGLTLQNRFNYAQDLRISMRGFGARAAFGIRGIRLVVDGIPETLPDGQGGVDGIDLSSVGRIEVLRGGAAAVYGNAGGGVVLIETQAPSATPQWRARIAGGSDGYRQSQLGYSGQHGRFGVVANVADLNYDGYRMHSATRNRQANLRLSLQQGDAHWQLSAHHTDQPEAFDPGGITASQAAQMPRSARDLNVAFNAGEALTQTRMGLRYRWRNERIGQFTLRGYGLNRDFAGNLPFRDGGQVAIDRQFTGVGAQWQRRWHSGPRALTLHAVFDSGLQRDDRQRFDNLFGVAGALTLDQREDVRAQGFALVADVVLSPQWSANVGVRRDAVRYVVADRFVTDGDDSGQTTFRQWSPTAGVHWQFTPAWSLYANTSRSFETPSTTELANPSQVGGFNPALGSALAQHQELGLRWRTSQHFVSVATYRIELEDELVPFELDDFPGRDFFANAGQSQRRGIEASWSAQWGAGWKSRFSYTWSDFTFRNFTLDTQVFDGNVVPGTAKHIAFAGIDYRNDAGWFAGVETTYVSDIVLNNANSARSDAFTRVELRAGRSVALGRWQLQPFVSVSNALDRAYAANNRINAFGQRYFEPGPDRSVFVGMTIGLPAF